LMGSSLLRFLGVIAVTVGLYLYEPRAAAYLLLGFVVGPVVAIPVALWVSHSTHAKM
ncbi:MAG: hypothetical protein IMW91_05375, partial [Firmicutes bacterium]|nr:hypothetical protein [Bacillota bacterium]